MLCTSSLSMKPDISLSAALNIWSSCAGVILLLRRFNSTPLTRIRSSLKQFQSVDRQPLLLPILGVVVLFFTISVKDLLLLFSKALFCLLLCARESPGSRSLTSWNPLSSETKALVWCCCSEALWTWISQEMG